MNLFGLALFVALGISLVDYVSSSPCQTLNSTLFADCVQAGYNVTKFNPNTSQEELSGLIASMRSKFENCSSLSSLMTCSVQLPRCPTSTLPCKDMCRNFVAECQSSSSESDGLIALFRGICELLPSNKCLSTPNNLTNSNSEAVKCRRLAIKQCQNSGYNFTSVSEAYQQMVESSAIFQDSEANSTLRKIICMEIAPPCDAKNNQTLIVPCRSMCNEAFNESQSQFINAFKAQKYCSTFPEVPDNTTVYGKGYCTLQAWPENGYWPSGLWATLATTGQQPTPSIMANKTTHVPTVNATTPAPTFKSVPTTDVTTVKVTSPATTTIITTPTSLTTGATPTFTTNVAKLAPSTEVTTPTSTTNVAKLAPSTEVTTPTSTTNVAKPTPSTEVTTPTSTTTVTKPTPSTKVTTPASTTIVTKPTPSTEVTTPTSRTTVTKPTPSTEVTTPTSTTNVTKLAPSTEVTTPTSTTNVPKPTPSTEVTTPTSTTTVTKPTPSTKVTTPASTTIVTKPTPSTEVTTPTSRTTVTKPTPSTKVTTPVSTTYLTTPTTSTKEATPASTPSGSMSSPSTKGITPTSSTKGTGPVPLTTRSMPAPTTSTSSSSTSGMKGSTPVVTASKGRKMSAGAIAGTVLGLLALLLAIVVGAICFRRYYRTKSQYRHSLMVDMDEL